MTVTPETIYQFIMSGGIGMIVSWVVEELRKVVPGFRAWWDALASEVRQRLIAVSGFTLSFAFYCLLAWAGLWSFPAGVVEWIALLIALATESFGISQFFYGQFLKRQKRAA